MPLSDWSQYRITAKGREGGGGVSGVGKVRAVRAVVGTKGVEEVLPIWKKRLKMRLLR